MSVRKALGKLALIGIGTLAVLLAARFIWDFVESKRLESFLKEAKASGLPVVRADLGPICPPPTNAFSAWKAADALQDGKFVAEVNLSEKLADLYDGRSVDGAALAVVKKGIADNRRSIDLLLESASADCFRTPLDQEVPGIKFASLMRLVRLIGLEALFKVEAGDAAGGVKEWIQGYRLARLIGGDPWLMGALIGIAEGRGLMAVLGRMASTGALGKPELDALLAELGSEIWHSRLAASTRGERVFSVLALRAMLKEGPRMLADDRWERLFLWGARPLIRRNFALQYRAYDEVEKLLAAPYFESAAGLKAFDEREGRRPWHRQMFGPGSGFSAGALKAAALEAMEGAARIGLASRLYFLSEKRLPASVADLVPAFLKQEPVDPFTGKAFVFKADGRSLLVYSLGSNGRDDGGRSTFLITQVVQEKDDDWAWRDAVR